MQTSSFCFREQRRVKRTFSSDEFSSFREQGKQKGTFSVKSSLCFREQRTKQTFLLKNSLHSREQKSEMRNTRFKKTKKGTHAQFDACIEKNEPIYLDSDYILTYDYLQSNAPHVSVIKNFFLLAK